MKIAIWYNLPSGGAKRALFDHVRGLVGRGHELQAWCPPTADRSYLPLSNLIPEHVVPLAWRLSPSRDGAGRWASGLSHLRSRAAALEAHAQTCGEEMERWGYDVVFANTCLLFAAPHIGRYVRGPKLLYLQEPNRAFYEAMPRLPWLAPPAGTGFTARCLDALKVYRFRVGARTELENARAFPTVLVNSYFSRESIARAYHLDARVCYLGVDTGQFHPPTATMLRERFVIGLGAVSPSKRVDLAIRALALVPAPRPPLVWVGNMAHDIYLGEMRQLAARLEVDLQIRSRVEDAELVDLLQRAVVMLYTSRLEPFGFAPLEANACGVPVVAVREGGIRETIVDGINGLLCDAEPAALATAVTRLLDHPAEAEALGRSAAQHVAAEWNLERSTDRIEAELRRAAAMSAV